MSADATSAAESSTSSQCSSPDEDIIIIPEDTKAKVKYLDEEGKVIIRKYGRKCELDGDVYRGGLDVDETKKLVSLLRAFTNVEGLTKQTAKDIRLKQVLGIILNTKRYRFPPPTIEIAREAFDRYEREWWGVDPENEIMDGPDDLEVAEEPITPRRPSKTSTATPAARDVVSVRPAPRNHPIYGEGGIMRGIIVVHGSKNISYRFDPSYKHLHVNCRVEGHNGLTVGAWWPQLRCAMRDGGHGAHMMGISGSLDRGADSVVISGAYGELDDDRGDVVLYSGSEAHENTDPDHPRISKGTRALQTARGLNKSIRVLRGAKAKWGGAPKVGFRYDGLYKIQSESRAINVEGGAYVRFKLVRESGQDTINLNIPTPREQRLFARVSEYY